MARHGAGVDLGFTNRGTGMNRHRSEENADLTHRLRHLEQLLAPRPVAPRAPADDSIGDPTPLLDIERPLGRMYVLGHEPHFRPVTLLQHVRRPRRVDPDPS